MKRPKSSASPSTVLSSLVLSSRIWASSQTLHLERLLKVAGATLRVKVHADAYSFQSWSRVERWDGTQWREVSSLGGALMASSKLGVGAVYVFGGLNSSRAIDAIESDATIVLANAMLVLESSR